jgi:hypothetical protein
MGIKTAAVKTEDREFPPDVPMPVGSYNAKVVFAMVKATKNGKVMFSVKWADVASRVAWQNIVVSPESGKAMEVFYRHMAACDLGADFLDADETTPEDIAQALLGAEAVVTVVDEEYQGKTYRKITWVD